MLKRFSIVPAVALLAALFMALAPSHDGRVVELRNFRFAPNDIRIEPGDAVTFENVSDDTHTVTCARCPSAIDAGDVQPGLDKTVTFRLPGTYIFACRYHQGRNMIARVQVGPAPSPSPSPS